MTISLFIVIAAVLCLFAAALNVNASRVSLGWLGLGLWCLSTVLRV